jgi:omega-amidase
MDLRVTLCQLNVIWENVPANLERIEGLLERHGKETDLVLLPELFSTGFTMNVTALAEPMDGRTVGWMKTMAGAMNAVIAASIIIREDDKFYNRLITAGPDGSTSFYDKRHLFRMSGENDHYSRGGDQLIITRNRWRICPLICYDLRFPVWSRNRNRNEYDVLIYLANWPQQRMDVWDTLLKARAIENHSYVIGINRVGTDGMDIGYRGQSMLVDFKGQVIEVIEGPEEELRTLSLEWEALQEFRKKFPVHLDADDFIIT